MDRKLRLLIDIVINIGVIVGTTCQVLMTGIEYFKYPTLTSVTIVDALPATNIPQVAVCNYYGGNFQWQLMDHPPDGSHAGGDPRLIPGSLEIAGYNAGDLKSVESKRFLVNSDHCFAVKTRHPVNIPPSRLHGINHDFLITFAIRVRLPLTGRKRVRANNFLIYMTSYDTDFDVPLRNMLRGHANFSWGGLSYHLSYLQRVIRLFPPPYDTNCRDYRRDGLVSKFSCTRKCINKFTVGHYNLIFYHHVVDRDKYLIRNNSSNSSSWLRLMTGSLEYYDREYALNLTKSNHTRRNLRYLDGKVDNITKRIKYCNDYCSRPDCETEYVIPLLLSINLYDEGHKFSVVNVTLGIPREPVIVVRRNEWWSLMDFIVFSLSCINFWFGWCPLHSTVINANHVARNSIGNFISSFFIGLSRIISRLFKFWRTFINIFAIAGFLFNSWHICDEYFKYPTLTSVSVVDALPVSTIPQVVVCTPWDGKDGNNSYVDKFQEQLMKSPPDGGHPGGDPMFTGGYMLQLPPITSRRSKISDFDMKHVLFKGSHCLVFKTRNPAKLPAKFLLERTTIYLGGYDFKISLPFTGDYSDRKDIDYSFYIISYKTDLDSHPLINPVIGRAVKNTEEYFTSLVYSQRISLLSPPPFDTNCRDYNEDGVMSQGSCVKSCINNFTINKYNLIFDDHVVSRTNHLIRPNSTTTLSSKEFLRPIPSEMKDTFRAIHDFNLSREYVDYLDRIFPSIRKRIDLCMKSCSQPDCETEYIITSASRSQGDEPDGKQLKNVGLDFSPSKEPVIIVTSHAEWTFLEFFIYLISCISFWFGFCPLYLSENKIHHVYSIITASRKVTTIYSVVGRFRQGRRPSSSI